MVRRFYTTLEGKGEEAHVLPVPARTQKEACDKCRKIVLANTGFVEVATRNLWGVRDDDRYDELLEALEDAVLHYLENHPELKETPNTEDMWDYRDSTYDVDDEDEEEDW